jgi:two-component system nitrogen regulation sensor histidine kinase NtrY
MCPYVVDMLANSNIAHNDFSTTTALQGDELTADLLDAQKLLIGKYKQLKADKSAQHEYLRMVIEHVDTALLCFDNSGKMVIANRAAKETLQTSSVINLSQVALVSEALGQALQFLKPGKNQLLKTVIAGETVQLLLAAREFKLLGKDHKLASIQNIQSAIDETG